MFSETETSGFKNETFGFKNETSGYENGDSVFGFCHAKNTGMSGVRYFLTDIRRF